MFKLLRNVVCLALILSCGVIRSAEKTGTPNFGEGFDNSILCFAFSSSEKLYVGGKFNNYKEIRTGGLVRLNLDGSIDTTFATPDNLDLSVHCLSLSKNNKVYIGGVFNASSDPYKVNCILRLNEDGTIDSSFKFIDGLNSVVAAIVELSNGSLLVGGTFNLYNGKRIPSLIKLNKNGELDTTVNFRLEPNFDVLDITMITEKSMLISGRSNKSNTNSPSIQKIQIDGVIDSSFAVSKDFKFAAWDCYVDEDYSIYTIGRMSNQDSSLNKIIEKLDTFGNVDQSYISPIASPNEVYYIVHTIEGSLIVCGRFNLLNNIPIKGIAMISKQGKLDLDFSEQVRLKQYPRTAILIKNKLLVVAATSANNLSCKYISAFMLN